MRRQKRRCLHKKDRNGWLCFGARTSLPIERIRGTFVEEMQTGVAGVHGWREIGDQSIDVEGETKNDGCDSLGFLE